MPLRMVGLGLQTSMRNQLPCRLLRMTKQGRAVRVLLQLSDGSHLASRITKESAELLGLVPGMALLALAKATAVQVIAEDVVPAMAQNALRGRVARIARARSGDEVVLTLDSGLQLVGFCPAGLRLTLSAGAVALLDESAVVLAANG